MFYKEEDFKIDIDLEGLEYFISPLYITEKGIEIKPSKIRVVSKWYEDTNRMEN
jgi:hypothetical protein